MGRVTKYRFQNPLPVASLAHTKRFSSKWTELTKETGGYTGKLKVLGNHSVYTKGVVKSALFYVPHKSL